MRVCPIALCLGLSTTLGLAGCVTSQSVGMDSFTQASNRCHDPYTYYSCMEGNAVSQNFTPAEHQLIAFRHLVIEKVKSGDISEAEGEYLIARYVNNAKAASDYSEAEQAKAVGEFVGAAAALTEEIEDRKCRAAGTC